MQEFKRPEHRAIGQALRCMDVDLLLRSRCWFAGGTAFVLLLGEYRVSKDLDFLCADQEGYRSLRMAIADKGVRALFREPVTPLRDLTSDQYGIRTVVEIAGEGGAEMPIRFEVVREARIALDGSIEESLGVPTACRTDLCAEKLLANADRGFDRAIAYRDVIDLGMMARAGGGLSTAAAEKAERAYGDVGRKLAAVMRRLLDPDERSYAAEALRMTSDDVEEAIETLREEGSKLWPEEAFRGEERAERER